MNIAQRLTTLSLLLAACGASAADRPLLQEGKQSLYQRVLTTPGCQLSNTAAGAPDRALPAFSRFYVYERSTLGSTEWLKVGPDSYGQSSGWLPASCTVEWKMQLSLAFTNPANRDRLLFFKDRTTLEKILDTADPASLVTPLRGALQQNGSASGVLAQEPEYFVDMQKEFYLLPVLSGEEVMTEQGFRTRILNVASVSKADSASASNPAGSAQNITSQLKEFSAAVVFVIDSTISMDPYIDRTREVISRIYQRIEKENLGKQVKFGLVAFRSNTDAVPGLEYTSRMYADPNAVQDGADFMARVSGLRQARVSSSSFDEDAFAGVMHAIDEVDWSQFGARYIVLVTDAGAIEGDNPLSKTGLNAEQVRIEAAKPGAAIYTLHLKTPAGSRNHAKAESQYRTLSTYGGTNTSLYYPVNAGDVNAFGNMVDALATAITTQVKAAYMGEDAIGSALNAETDSDTRKLLDDAALIGHAMRLAYLGEKTGTQAPPVFQAWISDRDLLRQNLPTTEVRVLMTKSQLSDLSDVLRQVLDAANEGLISPQEMFNRLRSVAATMGADPNKLKQSDNLQLAELGLLGEYLEDLPYQSEVLNLDEETWKSWDGLAQERFIRNLATKLRHYQRYNADVDRWVSLAEGSDARDSVYPVPLEMMP
ncbi:vWA domain-containing protein [Halopseudomonas yangmingensis]|uniref:Serine/threonine-protein kinase PpkA n=1 Tax=Halopseudomonas yangmingensis TaxID=1720063 RepID=A0A1I4P6X7_9GAMM|nr:vWA domain-containing protein [Halopseudomonas yangmingensis]SFM23558.1 serine/threonine-protein kinase PpkA [Halopseudomonas yangmingensis]